MLKNTPAMMADMMQALQPVFKKQIDERLAQAEKAATATDESGQTAYTGDTPTTANASMTGEAQRLRIDSGVSEGLLISQVPPVYPPLARQARIQGTVVLEAVIGKDGGIESLSLVSGHPMLIPAAMDAVKQWRYRPYLLNGRPVLVLTHINVDFTLQ
jgi:TonB family protein